MSNRRTTMFSGSRPSLAARCFTACNGTIRRVDRDAFSASADPSDPELISDLGECAEAGFCRRGRQLLTWEGDLIDCRSGRTIRKLDFPQTEYPIDTTNESDLQLGGLKGLTRLRSLNLSEMRVTDAELENLKGLTALQSLDLSETRVTDAGLEHLKGLTALQSLDLSGTRVTSTGVRELQKALPHCSIRFGEEWPTAGCTDATK